VLDDDMTEFDEAMLHQQQQGEEEEAELLNQKSGRERDRKRKAPATSWLDVSTDRPWAGCNTRDSRTWNSLRALKRCFAMFETQEGNFVEVDWQGEWWQAKIKKLKVRQSSGAQMGSVNRSHFNSRGEQVIAVFVEYVGGSEDENEWIQLTQNRWDRPLPSTNPFHPFFPSRMPTQESAICLSRLWSLGPRSANFLR
jgi:hypothetical protein